MPPRRCLRRHGRRGLQRPVQELAGADKRDAARVAAEPFPLPTAAVVVHQAGIRLRRVAPAHRPRAARPPGSPSPAAVRLLVGCRALPPVALFPGAVVYGRLEPGGRGLEALSPDLLRAWGHTAASKAAAAWARAHSAARSWVPHLLTPVPRERKAHSNRAGGRLKHLP